MTRRGRIREYINLPVIKTLSQHTTGALFAMLCFKVSGLIAAWLFPVGVVHDITEAVEEVGIIVVFLYLFFEMIWHLFGKMLWKAWKGRSHGSSRIIFVA
jgi:hypothetical protein